LSYASGVRAVKFPSISGGRPDTSLFSTDPGEPRSAQLDQCSDFPSPSARDPRRKIRRSWA